MSYPPSSFIVFLECLSRMSHVFTDLRVPSLLQSSFVCFFISIKTTKLSDLYPNLPPHSPDTKSGAQRDGIPRYNAQLCRSRECEQ